MLEIDIETVDRSSLKVLAAFDELAQRVKSERQRIANSSRR